MDSSLHYVFDFLRDLKRHNTREWMHTRANAKRYDIVQRTMERFVALLLLDMSDIESTRGLKPKDCLFRIWRDTRFSKDKTPCKTWISFVVRAGGRRNDARASYYVHLGPGGQSFAGGGVYMPEPAQLRAIRRAIAADPGTFSHLAERAPFKKMFGGLEVLKLKTMPRDYRSADLSATARRWLPYTSFVATRTLTDAQVLAGGFEAELVRTFQVLKPLNDWLNEAMH